MHCPYSVGIHFISVGNERLQIMLWIISRKKFWSKLSLRWLNMRLLKAIMISGYQKMVDISNGFLFKTKLLWQNTGFRKHFYMIFMITKFEVLLSPKFEKIDRSEFNNLKFIVKDYQAGVWTYYDHWSVFINSARISKLFFALACWR